MTEPREVVLGRIRNALGTPREPPEIPRAYAAAVSHSRTEAVELFCERVADYGANVTRCDGAALSATLARICDERDLRRVAAVDELGEIARVDAVGDDPPLTVTELDHLDGVVTGCAIAIATTGTIVLDGGPLSGRRALTLVPDFHVCVVRASQIVFDVPSAIEAIREAAVAGRPITLVSGPSATSDIELERVEGVHGPRHLDVVLVDG